MSASDLRVICTQIRAVLDSHYAVGQAKFGARHYLEHAGIAIAFAFVDDFARKPGECFYELMCGLFELVDNCFLGCAVSYWEAEEHVGVGFEEGQLPDHILDVRKFIHVEQWSDARRDQDSIARLRTSMMQIEGKSATRHVAPQWKNKSALLLSDTLVAVEQNHIKLSDQ